LQNVQTHEQRATLILLLAWHWTPPMYGLSLNKRAISVWLQLMLHSEPQCCQFTLQMNACRV